MGKDLLKGLAKEPKVLKVEQVVNEIKTRFVVSVKEENPVVREVILKTASVSPLTKSWVSAAKALYPDLNIQALTDAGTKVSKVIYKGNSNEVEQAIKASEFLEDQVMLMVKANSNGTRSNSVELKRSYYNAICFALNPEMSDDTLVKKLEKKLEKKPKADKKPKEEPQILITYKTEDFEEPTGDQKEDFEESGEETSESQGFSNFEDSSNTQVDEFDD